MFRNEWFVSFRDAASPKVQVKYVGSMVLFQLKPTKWAMVLEFDKNGTSTKS